MLNTAKLYFHQKNAIKRHLLLWLVLGLSAPVGQADNTDVPQPEVSKDIVDIITTKQHPYLKLSNFANRSDDLDSLYKLTEYKLLWLETDESQKNIPSALELLSNVAINGLNPTNYDVDGLKSRWQSIRANPNSYKEQALLDTALSISLLRFMHDLHYGRVNPQGIKFNLKLREKKTN
jgi:murein L,D-transpeptidase YcbB/YkuD